MTTASPDFMMKLRQRAEAFRELCEPAICASPNTIKTLKEQAWRDTGVIPKAPYPLFGCAVFEFPYIPDEQVLVVDRSFAQRLHDQRIPFSEE